jgi:hypothetical protein
VSKALAGDLDRSERLVAIRRYHRQYLPHEIGNMPSIVA